MSNSDPIVLVSALRTPMGGFSGCLANVDAPMLGADAIKAAVAQANLGNDQIDEVIMGCVLPAGLKQAPAIISGRNTMIEISTISSRFRMKLLRES